MTHATDLLGLVAAIAAALVAVGYMIRLALRIADVVEALAAIVRRELTPNGGSSLRDDVIRIREDMATTKERVQTVVELAESNAGRLDTQEATLADHIKRTETT